MASLFQLTAPLREPTTMCSFTTPSGTLFQLTAPLREPTRTKAYNRKRPDVSTHGSLAGADIARYNLFMLIGVVSTHGSLAGADCTTSMVGWDSSTFQLTAPLREPTYCTST